MLILPGRRASVLGIVLAAAPVAAAVPVAEPLPATTFPRFDHA